MGWRIHPLLDLMCILLLTPPLKFFQHAQEEIEAVAAGSAGISVFHPRLQEDTLGCRINRKIQAIHNNYISTLLVWTQIVYCDRQHVCFHI